MGNFAFIGGGQPCMKNSYEVILSLSERDFARN